MESLLSMHRKMTGEYELKLQKLRNPWVSVDDVKTKPAVGQQILIEYPNGEHGLAHFVVNYQGISTFETFEVIRWMSIPY